MFLIENSTHEYYAEATADPSYMLEAVMEANEEMHELSMKMVKCEHACIVNENSDMLSEAEASFGEKVKKVAQTLLAKFMAFIDRVRAEWSKLWANIISKMVDRGKVLDLYDAVGGKTIKVETGADIKRLDQIIKLYDEVLRPDQRQKTVETLKQYMPSDTKPVKQLRKDDLQKCVEFLDKRPEMIKRLEKFKAEAKRVYNEDCRNNNAKPDQLALAQFSSAVSKVIVCINKYTSEAVKIVRAFSKAAQGKAGYKEAEKARQDAIDKWNGKDLSAKERKEKLAGSSGTRGYM